MGACFSVDKPMLIIGTKTVKASKFHTIVTFRDALMVAGKFPPENAAITLIKNEVIIFTTAGSKFYFVDGINYKGTMIPVRKLYGK
jgi:hypothetical protein